MDTQRTKPKKPVHNFAWVQVGPNAFECHYGAVKMRIEQDRTRSKWTFWARHPVKGMIADGVAYDSHQDACSAAEEAAIDSLRNQSA